jgi:hypothetical protein
MGFLDHEYLPAADCQATGDDPVSRVRAGFRNVASEISSNKPTAVVAVADKMVDPVEDTLRERPIATIALVSEWASFSV